MHGGTSAPDGIRTHNLWLRRPILYPVELRAQGVEEHVKTTHLQRAMQISTLAISRKTVRRKGEGNNDGCVEVQTGL
jgi:hypothetical protein